MKGLQKRHEADINDGIECQGISSLYEPDGPGGQDRMSTRLYQPYDVLHDLWAWMAWVGCYNTAHSLRAPPLGKSTEGRKVAVQVQQTWLAMGAGVDWDS